MCKTSDVDELRQGQAILLPVLFGLSLSEVGQVIGRSKATVSRLQARFRAVQAGQESPRKNWGGRRRQNMSLEEEDSFLEPFFENAKEGGMVVVSSIKAAYEKALGRSVPASTDLPHACTSWVAQDHSDSLSSQSRPGGAASVEKNFKKS